MLKLKKFQEIVGNDLEITFGSVEQVVSHGVVGQLSYFPLEFFGESGRIFAETVGYVYERCIDLVDIQNSVQTAVFHQYLVNILTNHGHCSLDLL